MEHLRSQTSNASQGHHSVETSTSTTAPPAVHLVPRSDGHSSPLPQGPQGPTLIPRSLHPSHPTYAQAAAGAQTSSPIGEVRTATPSPLPPAAVSSSGPLSPLFSSLSNAGVSTSQTPPPTRPPQVSIAVQSLPSMNNGPVGGAYGYPGLLPPLSDTLAAQHFFLNRILYHRDVGGPTLVGVRHISPRGEEERHIRPQFRSKIVCEIDCKHCESTVCKRGMKAILLADMNVELYSTDAPPFGVALVFDDYRTKNCACRIRDVACLGCGNVIGYHVTQPCEPCLEACNNGHFWMFHMSEVNFRDRMDGSGKSVMVWGQLPRADRDGQAVGDVDGESGLSR